MINKPQVARFPVVCRLLAQLRGVPVVQMSGLHKKGSSRLLGAADEMYRIWNTRISTGRLNRWLDPMLEAHPPPLVGRVEDCVFDISTD